MEGGHKDEDDRAVLNGLDETGSVRAALAEALDLVHDRDGRGGTEQEVALQYFNSISVSARCKYRVT